VKDGDPYACEKEKIIFDLSMRASSAHSFEPVRGGGGGGGRVFGGGRVGGMVRPVSTREVLDKLRLQTTSSERRRKGIWPMRGS